MKNEYVDVALDKNGKYWRARWVDAKGERRSQSLGPIAKVSKSAALRACRELGTGMMLDPWTRTPNDGPTLAIWKDRYLALRRDELRPRVVTLHEQTIGYLIAFLGGELRIGAVSKGNAAEFRAWLSGLKEADNKTPRMTDATVCLHVRNARVFFQRAADLDLIRANPFSRVRGTPAKVVKDWKQVSDADLAKIFEHCPNEEWRLLFALCRWAGIRRGEALRLTWADFDWNGRTLSVVPEVDDRGVRRETTKQKARTVPIRPELFSMLQASYEAAPDGSLGPCCLHADRLDGRARAIVGRSLGAVYSKPFHTLRKCCLSEWATKVMPATLSAWSGDRIETLMEHYVRVEATETAKVTGQASPAVVQIGSKTGPAES